MKNLTIKKLFLHSNMKIVLVSSLTMLLVLISLFWVRSLSLDLTSKNLALLELVDVSDSRQVEHKASIDKLISRLEVLYVVIPVVFIILVVVLFVMTSILSNRDAKALVDPVRDLLVAMDRISIGDFDFDLEINSDNEIGQLSFYFTKMKGYLVETKNKNIELVQELMSSVTHAQKLAKAKTDFLANMSHEIRTPLNGILGITEAMAHEELSSKHHEYLDLISFSGNNLLTIVNEVLDYSKIQSGKMSIEKRVFNIDILIESIKSCFQVQADAKGLHFNVEKGENTPDFIFSDDTRIFQILNNIIGNSIKFTAEGFVQLSIDSKYEQGTDTDYLFFEISDSGIGMDDDGLGKLFIPFEQAETSTSRHFGGTGLGLSIVKEILKMMEGEVKVQSEIGKGSKFVVSVPYSKSSSNQLAKADVQLLPTDIKFQVEYDYEILVAEDNLVNQKVIKALLSKLGYMPEFANNGAEVLEALEYKPFQIILMDMMMPVMGGLEATRKIREMQLDYDVYIIGLTANASSEARVSCLESGMDYFLTKPIKISELKNTISSLIPRKRSA